MPPPVKVHVIESDGEIFVRPPAVSAEKTDSLRIFNATSEDLVFHIDADVVALADKTKIVKSQKKETLNILNSALDGSYPFQILMVKSGKKAKGNSDPVLIIDNP